MAVPLKSGGMKVTRVLFYIFMSGVTTGLGAFFGALVGQVSNKVIALCLAFAGGAMLYIVSGELLPEANSLHRGRVNTLGTIAGFILGLLATKL